jgi:SNF2 family DNA or RNA helicase
MNNCETEASMSTCATPVPLQSKPSSVAWTPRPYQIKTVKYLIEHAVAGIFLDMSLGKTSCVLAALKILKDKGFMKRTLIVAPLRVCYAVWPEERGKWTDFAGLRIEILHGPKKDEAILRDADIYLINPDGLEWLMLGDRAKKLGCDVLVVDESDAFKHARTLRSKLLKYLIPTMRRRYILTGTPATNGLLDLHGQILILDQGNALGKFIGHYKQAYFDQSGFGGYTWTPKVGAADAIYEKLRPMVLRMDANDYLTLPERIDNVVRVDLPAKARKIYGEIEREFLTTLENGESITAPSAAAAGMKLRQIANGGMYRNFENRVDAKEHSEEWVLTHDAKLDALEEIIGSQQGKPVLVAYEFEHDATRIRKRFPKAVFLADFKGAKVLDVIRAWNNGEIEVLCAHPASCGHGLNLQGGGNTIIWFGLTFNLALYQQLNARVRRSGSAHSHVIVHHIVARNTVDEAVMKALRSKDQTQKSLLDALKEYKTEVENGLQH